MLRHLATTDSRAPLDPKFLPRGEYASHQCKKTMKRVPTNPSQSIQAIAHLRKGFALHNAGELDEALAEYQKVLKRTPNHFDALQLSGAIALQKREWGMAIRLLTKAIAIKGSDAFVHYNLGNALLESGLLDAAVRSYEIAIKFKPDYADAYFNKGISLKRLGLFECALGSFEAAIEHKKDYSEAHSNRGVTLHKLGRLDEAIGSYETSILLKPNYAEAHSNMGVSLRELGRLDEALFCAERAIGLKPEYAEAYSNRGVTLLELKRFDEALQSYDCAISLTPDFAEAHSNRGVCLQKLGRTKEALESYETAVNLKPDFDEAYTNYGNALVEFKRLDDAIARYDQAIELNANNAEAHWNKGLAHLLKGDFEVGFQQYEWRWKSRNVSKGAGIRSFSSPLWLGEYTLENKTILLYGEQGLGDVIQFCRYASLVKKRGAKVLMQLPRSLISVGSHLGGVDLLIDEGQTPLDFDYHCPLLSLPLAFKTKLTSVPCQESYIRSCPEKRQIWTSRIGPRLMPRIGLTWSGRDTHINDKNRSLSLETLLENLPPNFEYISLQKDVREGDTKFLKQSNIKHYGELLTDFGETAALCDLMDVVITVDTSVAHLSGAIGRPTWILLPYIPDWRWLLNGEDSPWYKSVKLYRQREDRQFAPVLKEVSCDLLKMVF